MFHPGSGSFTLPLTVSLTLHVTLPLSLPLGLSLPLTLPLAYALCHFVCSAWRAGEVSLFTSVDPSHLAYSRLVVHVAV